MTEDRERRFTRLLHEFAPAVARLARAYTETTSDADDLAQEIAITLWRALPTFRGECSERTFVYRVAHNRAFSWRRSSHRSQRHTTIDDSVVDPTPRADDLAEGRDAASRLRVAVRRLPDTLQQAVLLRLEGLSDAEIAEVTGASVGNVAVRLTRARKALRDLLGELP